MKNLTLVSLEIFLIILAGIACAMAFVHLVLGIMELAALLGGVGAVMTGGAMAIEWRRLGF